MTTKIKEEKKEPEQIFKGQNIKAQLISWAHEGTRESVQKIKDFIAQNDNEDEELKFWAETALEEGEYFCYTPNNEKEEYNFQLAQMVFDREDKLYYKIAKANAARLELRKLDVERRVYKEVLRNAKNNSQTEDWKYNFCEDYYSTVRARLRDLESELAYEEVWLEEAKEIVKQSEYKNIDRDFFESIHENCEGINFWSDDENWEEGEDFKNNN